MALRMWILAVVVISTSFVLSSAQSEAQPSPQCIAAYNATYIEGDTYGCYGASLALLFGNNTDEQRMTVCSAGQPCNTMIENVIDICGDTIDNPTRTSQNLLCTTGTNGMSCLNAFLTALNDGLFDKLEQISTNCTGSCGQSCMQGLMQLNDTLGCCFLEIIIQIFTDNGATSNTQASLFANTYPAECGLRAFTFCNGTALPTDPCGDASIRLFSANDECSRTIQGLLSGNDSTLMNLYNGDCPTRFHEYAITCSGMFGGSDGFLVQIANTILTISQATASNGRSCTELLTLILSGQLDNTEDEADCTRDYFLNQCSSGCRQILMNITAEYGCCFNLVFSELTARSNEIDEQIEYPILTREIYSLCGLSSPGFCTGTSPPPLSNAAEKCISARNSFLGDSTCLDYYLTLGERPSATAVNSAATAICASQRCKNRMRSYIDFLINCRVENLLNDEDDDDDDDDDDNDDDDDDDDEEEDTRYLQFAYLIGNTTCRVDSSNTTCYSTFSFNQQYALVSAAFDVDNPNASCLSSLNGTCSTECMQLLMTIYNDVGCCLGEYNRALLGTDVATTVSTRCGIPSLTDQCIEIAAIQDAGGANTQRGLGIIVISLLGVVTIMLS